MHRRLIVPALLTALAVCPVLARQAPAVPPADPGQPPAQPSLDDLLGLPNAKPADKARAPAPDPARAELDRKLSASEIADQFKQAVHLMDETAQRLQTARDTGLATQRLQEDIIRKLDQLIKSAEQNQQQSKSSQSQQQRDKQQPQPNQQQQQRNPDGVEAAPDTMEPPPGQGANPAPGVAARGAAWGSLPTRLRDALLQGNEDKYSSLYQKWTEAFYRRLAEDANR